MIPKPPFKSIAAAVTLALGVICEALGIHLLYQKTMATIAKADFSAGLVLLIIGLILILAGLSKLSNPGAGQKPERSWFSRNWSMFLGTLIAIVLLGVYISLNYKPAQAADKYDLLLNLTLILLAVTGAIGYGIFKWISREIAEQVKTEKLEIKESQGFSMARTTRQSGYLYWSLFDIREKHGILKESEGVAYKKELLDKAIGMARLALTIAQDLPKSKDEYKREIYLCINNLVYFLSEIYKHEIKELELTDKEKEGALTLARELLAGASKENYPEDFYDFRESSAWALYHLTPRDDVVSKEKACEVLRKLLADADIPSSWRQENKRDWTQYLGASACLSDDKDCTT